MDGENHGKPYFLMDDVGGTPHHFRKPPIWAIILLDHYCKGSIPKEIPRIRYSQLTNNRVVFFASLNDSGIFRLLKS